MINSCADSVFSLDISGSNVGSKLSDTTALMLRLSLLFISNYKELPAGWEELGQTAEQSDFCSSSIKV